MIKTNIKMRVTPEQSRRVQEICFENGFVWVTSGKKFQDFYEWIYIDKEKLYSYRSLINEEISADLFIKTNGTCELTDPVDIFEDICNQINKETYLTKYTSQPKDLKSALKKIENLHIALNKKVEKNKNQALEITKLLEQKKDLQQQRVNESKGYCDLKKEIDDLQEINDSHVEYIKELENRLNQLSLSGANTNDTNNYIDDLRNRLKEKDIIISYLRNELK